jgi:hypothetical protein
MKNQTIISVKTTNYETFEKYPNADFFREEFLHFALNNREFAFENDEDFEQAKTRLNDLNLDFQVFYKIILESDDELSCYGAVYVIFSSEPDLLKNDGNNRFVLNRKKIKGFDIRKDFKTDILVISNEMKTFLETIGINFNYIQIDSVGSNNYYLIKDIPELKNSPIPEADGVQESANKEFPGYYCTGTNGIVRLPIDAVEEIKEIKMIMSNHFYFKDIRYKESSSSFLCTGEIAYHLKQFLRAKPEQLEIFVPFLDD